MKWNWKIVAAPALLALAAFVAFTVLRRDSRPPEAPLTGQSRGAPTATNHLAGPPESSAPGSSASNLAGPGAPAGKTVLELLSSLSRDPVTRQQELDSIAANVSGTDLERTLDLLWNSSRSGARELSAMLIRRWAREMPGLAAAWVTQKGEGQAQGEAALAVATVWAGQKAGAAADWVRQWPEERKDAGLLAVAYEAARSSPRDALFIAAELPPGGQRDDLIRNAVSNWAAADAETPVAWAAKLEPSGLRDEVIAGLSLALSEKDPSNAAQLAIQSLPPGKRQNDVVVGIVQRWGQSAPAEAAQWVDAFPEGPLREFAAENLAQIWAGQSPAETGEWLNRMPPGGARDAAVAAYSDQLAASAPASAAVWVEAIENPERRLAETERLARRWGLTDPAAVRTWLEKAALPPELKSKLDASLPKAGAAAP